MLQSLLSDFGLKQTSVDIYCDNQYAIYLAYNPVYHGWTEYINIRYHFIRDVLVNGNVIVKEIAIADNSIIIMTKFVLLAKLKLCLSSIGVCEE